MARPGHAHQQHMAAGQERDQRLLDDPLLTEDHPADLLPDPVEPLDRALDSLRDVVGRPCSLSLHRPTACCLDSNSVPS